MKFIIDRSKWRCGGSIGDNIKGQGDTLLKNNLGYMCCLGFVSNQLGVSLEKLSEKEVPFDVMDDRLKPLLITDNGDTFFTKAAISINDNTNTDSKRREFELNALFNNNGHEIEFVGEYQT